jgi:hypothetical protein
MKDKLLSMLETGGTLWLDNDCCFVSFEGQEESESFNFTPSELVEILAEKLNFKTEHV